MHLGLLSRKAVRAFNKALRRKRKSLEDSHAARVHEECSHSFWKFASRVLDEDGSAPPVFPAFDAASAVQHFREVYSSEPHTYSHPDWLPQAASPHVPFDYENIRPEEVANAIKCSNSSSSPSPSIKFHTGFSNSLPPSFQLLAIYITSAGRLLGSAEHLRLQSSP